jgi:hypothetical protein
VKKLAKKSRKNRKHSSYLAAWDNSFSLVDDSSYYSKIQNSYLCLPHDVNKIAVDVFGALSINASDLI